MDPILKAKCEIHEFKKDSEAILDRAEAEGNGLTDDEQMRLDRNEAAIRALEFYVERGGDKKPLGFDASSMLGPGSASHSACPPGGTGGHTYAEMFGRGSLSMGGWKDSNEFFGVLHAGLNDSRLVPMATATGSVPSDGGFSVPSQLVASLLDASLEDEIVRPRADVVPMTTSTRKAWGFDASSSSSTIFGGFAGGWCGEAAEINVETPKAKLIELVANKLPILARVSNELLADGMGYAQQLEASMVKAIGWFMDLAFLTGTGAGQPLGVLNAASTVAVDPEGGQTADTIIYENLAAMLSRLHPACVNKAIWVANPACRAQLLQLAMPVGTGGSHVPVLSGNAGMFEMLTLPVVFSEKLPALGDAGDIMLADFSQYQIGLRQDMSLDKSAHVGFTSDTTYYRAILRGDGQPKWASAYSPKNGASLSWAVTLAART